MKKDNCRKIQSSCIRQLGTGPAKYCRSWQLVLRLPSYIDKMGNTKYPVKVKKFKGTKTEAKEALEYFEEEYLMDIEIENAAESEIMLHNFLDGYYILRKEQADMAPKSIDRIKICFGNFKLNHKDIPIDEVTKASVDAALISMKKGNTLSGKIASAESLNKTKIYVNQAFDYALDNGILDKNPCKRAIHFKVPKPIKKALTKEQFNDVLNQLDMKSGTQFGIALCLLFGLRQSEVLNLRWGDISEKEIKITKSKTEAGKRVLPIYPLASKYINIRKEILRGELKANNNYLTKNMYVTCNSNELTRGNDNRLSKWWQRNSEGLGVGNFTLHELRHTYATNLAKAGVSPVVMKKLLGHSSSLISLDIYTHVNSEELIEAQNKLQKVL